MSLNYDVCSSQRWRMRDEVISVASKKYEWNHYLRSVTSTNKKSISIHLFMHILRNFETQFRFAPSSFQHDSRFYHNEIRTIFDCITRFVPSISLWREMNLFLIEISSKHAHHRNTINYSTFKLNYNQLAIQLVSKQLHIFSNQQRTKNPIDNLSS